MQITIDFSDWNSLLIIYSHNCWVSYNGWRHSADIHFAVFCVLGENKKSRFRLEIRILLSFAFLQSGATRNRNLMISGWISLMYILAKEVISRYCSTGFLQYFAVSCGVDFLLLYKGNALFWNTSRCLVFLLHLGVGYISKHKYHLPQIFMVLPTFGVIVC